MSTPKIEIVNLHKSFGSKRVLEGINLSVDKGESRVILGGSGSGKSVLLKCILGLLNPTEGQVLIDGQNTVNLKENERYDLMRRFGMLFQHGALFDSLTVWENVSFGLLQQGEKSKRARDTAVEKLSLVGLNADVAQLKPAELSGGMQKRVALARAICMEPEIIFYDEPTTGLDPIMADVINNLIIKLREELGVTSIAITHDMHSAYKIADRISMLYKGRMLVDGTVKEIKNSDNPYVYQFINGLAEGPIQMTT